MRIHSRVSRLKEVPGIGVDRMGNRADAAQDPSILRLENLDTDISPPSIALDVTKQGVCDDKNNSYLPFLGQDSLRQAAVERVARVAGSVYDWQTECVISAGGMSGILNCLLALLEPGDEVVVTDPTYAGIINRIHIAGGIPKFVPLTPSPSGWRLDTDALYASLSTKTKALLISPGMPTGHVLTNEEWEAVAKAALKSDAWLIYDAAMERILYDGRKVVHPASFPGMKERTITIGAASKELRMIGWRVGWIVGPKPIMEDIALVSISNVVCQTGISMQAAAYALKTPNDGLDEALKTWQERRDILLINLKDLSPILPHGGWSLLVDARPLGMTSSELANILFNKAKIATTPMIGWGDQASHYVRFVFSNEPKERLASVGERVRNALNIKA